jgi:hypothetical protein
MKSPKPKFGMSFQDAGSDSRRLHPRHPVQGFTA